MDTISVPVSITSLSAALTDLVGSVELESNAGDILAMIKLMETLDGVLDRLMPIAEVA
jgi:hypothetical protein